ncbi:MAG TPA: sugar transferase [Phycisphaerae bacterium]|nr:sugar transferase [Phycisphaerae bacterium]
MQLFDRLAGVDLAFLHLRNGADQYQEQVTVGRAGQITDVARRYLTDLAVEPCAPGACQMIAIRASALREVCRNQRPSNFSRLRDAAASGGLRSCHLKVAVPTYDLTSDGDIVRLQDDMFAYHRELLPKALRSAGVDAVVTAESVSIDHSALVRGPAVLGHDVRILAKAIVLGPCTVGDGVIVGRGCVVRNSVLLPGASIPAGARVDSCVVGDSPSSAPAGRNVNRPRVGNGASNWNDSAPQDGAIPSLKNMFPRTLKRTADIVLSSIALALLAPAFPLVALAIKLSSRGPVFYVDRRQTMGGRTFGCLKFRTMVVDAKNREEELRTANAVDGLHVDILDDPRITRIGQLLRQTNLDETPQFINVLLGHMSLVGPRPSPDNENRLCPAWREARLSVRPGITGLWQVCRSRYRGDNDFQEWIYYDIEYVRCQSIGLDLRIMCRTLQIVAVGFLPVLRRLGLPRTGPTTWWQPKAERQTRHGGRAAIA